MCIALWSLEHPKYALVICTNRDEYLSRPTSHAHFHSFGDLPENEASRTEEDLFVLSGRDLQAGGTWFGINRAGRVALLTNISEETTRSYSSSRGQLVSSFLLPEALNAKPEDYIHDLTHKEPSADYAGFNLVLFSPSSSNSNPISKSSSGTADKPSSSSPKSKSLSYTASLVTNSGGGGVITSRPLSSEERCVGGVSNGVDTIDGQSWPKVMHGRDTLASVLAKRKGKEDYSEDELIEELFSLLAWQPRAPPSNRRQLRTSIHISPLAMTASLHPDAQPHPNAEPHHYYGTRLSTILLITKEGRVRFVERDIWKLAAHPGAAASTGSPARAPTTTTTPADGILNTASDKDKVQTRSKARVERKRGEDSEEEDLEAEGEEEDRRDEEDDDDDDEIVIRGDPRAQREYRFIIAAPGTKSSE